MTRASIYAACGAVLGTGAPLGWLAIRVVGFASHPITELRSATGLYAYLLIGTVCAFTAFGAFIGHFADKLSETNAALARDVVTDPLTGLKNARYFRARLDEAVATAKRRHEDVALIVIDLDRFKAINDKYGHAVGDQVLAHAARRLGACVRGGDSACRIGGEEFAVLCPATGMRDANLLAERIRVDLEKSSVDTSSGKIQLTASFGVAVTDGRESAREIFDAADRALYLAKRSGRNRVESVMPSSGP